MSLTMQHCKQHSVPWMKPKWMPSSKNWIKQEKLVSYSPTSNMNHEPSFSRSLVLPGIGQTIELLTVPAPSAELPSTATAVAAASSQASAEILLQELTTMIQHPPADLVPMQIESRAAASSTRTGNTAVKSTVTSTNNNATIRKPVQQQTTQQQAAQDERMFFGRPTTIGQGQYHNRTGLMSGNKQPANVFQQQQPQQQQQQQQQQRRPISWFQ